MRDKKAQITLFIIIGIIMLISFSVFFMIQSSSTKEQLESSENKLVVEKVGTQFRPIQQYVAACVHDVAKEGLRKAGLHGGYIYTDNLVSNKIKPTSDSANSILFWPKNEEMKIPYWWHMTSKEGCAKTMNCEFESQSLDLVGDDQNAVEGQLEKYVEENIDSCLNSFNEFRKKGYNINPISEPEADVTFGSEDVFVQLNYPFDAEFDGQKQDLNFYNIKLDINFREIYTTAKLISFRQAKDGFLETLLINIISIYSGTRSDSLLPPMFAPAVFDFESPKLMWSQTGIKQTLSSMLASFVPMINVIDAKNYVSSENFAPHDSIFYDTSMVFLNYSNAIKYDVYFDYKSWWDPFINLGKSEIIEGEKNVPSYIQYAPLVKDFIEMMLPRKYQVGYDVSFPVTVTVRDESAYDGEGYTFVFALESNVRDNLPVVPSRNDGGSISGKNAQIYQSIYCNVENFNSGNITIPIYDAQTQEPLLGAKVNYQCMDEQCYIGVSKNHGGDVVLKGQFPVCFNGLADISYPGYENKKIPITTSSGGELELPKIYLEPIRTLKAKVRIYPARKGPNGWAVAWNKVDVRESESVVITLKRLQTEDDPYLEETTSFVYFDGPAQEVDLELLPGKYEIQGQLLFDVTYENDAIEKLKVDEETKEVETGFLSDPKEVTLPEIDLGEMFPEGALYIDQDHGATLEITKEDLDENGYVTFYLIASPYIFDGLKLTYDDVDILGKADYYSDVYKNRLKPCFGDDQECI